jgi:hypothetical protein
MIDPNMWADKKIMKLDNNTLLLFIGLISNADDEAIVEIDPDSIYYRLARKELPPDKIVDSLKILTQEGLIVVYGNYALIPNFYKHQKLNWPTQTKLRRPPREIIEKFTQYIAGWEQYFKKKYPFNESSMRTHPVLNENSMRTHGEPNEDSPTDQFNTIEFNYNKTEFKRRQPRNRRELAESG